MLGRLSRLAAGLRKPGWRLNLSAFSLLWLAVFAAAAFFRFYQLAQVPPEMNSDHAEKLLDVMDVLNGQTSIFFPRNTGREPLQFYLTALTAQVFGTGISFLSLKIGAALAGLLVLPFIYLLGKEMANRRVGLLAMAFAGIAYWPNALSRVALRFSLYPLFVAPSLYYLLRGLRSGRRNDFILSGLFLGFGLLGYTPIRILPFVILAVVALYLLHHLRQPHKAHRLLGLCFVGFFAFIASLPLLRYAQENPASFSYRAFSRLTDIDTSLPQPAGVVFLDNLKNALLMFNWNDGQIWPISIPGRPALDVVSATLFSLGAVLLILRYLRQRSWEDLFLLLAVPMLMLPSILSLAFPAENPAPNRASGALVPVFLIIGLSLDGLMHSFQSRLANRTGARLAVLAALVLFGIASLQNYDLVFRQYQQQYALSAWNTSEMGQVLADFVSTSGSSLDATWVVKSPHWVDTRLVGMHAGNPARDFGIDMQDILATAIDFRPKLFLVRHFLNPEDRLDEEQTLLLLQQAYPLGWAQLYDSQYLGKDFWMFVVPPTVPGLQTPLYPEQTTP
jgi:4-amino-4-deoxy-L-arabinose transferase-like glycosyltransferase